MRRSNRILEAMSPSIAHWEQPPVIYKFLITSATNQRFRLAMQMQECLECREAFGAMRHSVDRQTLIWSSLSAFCMPSLCLPSSLPTERDRCQNTCIHVQITLQLFRPQGLGMQHGGPWNSSRTGELTHPSSHCHTHLNAANPPLAWAFFAAVRMC